MARQFGYGVANTNGIRDFSGKTPAVAVVGINLGHPIFDMGYYQLAIRGLRSIILFLIGA